MEVTEKTELKEDIEVTAAEPWYLKEITLEDAKLFIKTNIVTVARSFIAIGFYLKCVRDRNLFKDDGYDNIWDFAKKEYGISKSTASRYMDMNDMFSIDGNSPQIREEYQGYDKSKLQEMLYLEDEQLQEVTPDMTVKEIRSMKPPKEYPYIPIPGQSELEIDFPEIFPDVPAVTESHINMAASPGIYTMDVSEMLLEPDPVSVATSQQSEPDSVPAVYDEKSSCPPDMHSCMRQEWGQTPDEQEVGKKECKKCWDQWKRQSKILESINMEPVEIDRTEIPLFTLDSKKTVDGAYGWRRSEIVRAYLDSINSRNIELGEKQLFDIEFENMGEAYTAELNDSYITFSQDGIPLFAVEIERLWYEYDWQFPDTTETIPYSDDEDPQQDKECAAEPQQVVSSDVENIVYTPRYFLDEQNQKLNTMLEMEGAPVKLVERQKMIVAALAAMVCELELEEFKAELSEQSISEQPELPALKNNKQRGDFVDAYETWPLWVEIDETEERYYRYNLPDGTAMVVKVYHARLFDYNAVGINYEDRYRDGWGRQEYYLLKDDKHFRDCDTNRSALIEHLKDIQKKVKE